MSRIAELVLELKSEMQKVYPHSQILEITVNRPAWEAIRYTTTEKYLYDIFHRSGVAKNKELVGVTIKVLDYNSQIRLGAE